MPKLGIQLYAVREFLEKYYIDTVKKNENSQL